MLGPMAQRIVITGANRGIGLGLARAHAERGDDVHATAREPEAAAELRALRGVTVYPLDVGSDASVARFAGELGDAPVQVLYNNAGIGGGWKALPDVDLEECRRAFEVNALGPMRVTRALLPALRAARAAGAGSRVGSKVIDVTSRMGSIGDTDQGRAYAYRLSKAAQNMATKCFAIELAADGVVCIALHPGWVQTDMGGRSAPTPLATAVSQIT